MCIACNMVDSIIAWKPKRKMAQPLHIAFPEILLWREGDVLNHYYSECISYFYQGSTEYTIVIKDNDGELRELSLKELRYWTNKTRKQREIRERLNNSQYNKFLQACRDEYEKLSA